MVGCDTQPATGLIPFDEALDVLLGYASPVNGTETVGLTAALNRIMANDLKSAINVPPAANSAMDGYAICYADVNHSALTTLKVTQRIAAGETGWALASGEAARIFTGAPIPANSDTVIMQEQVEADETSMTFTVPVTQGQNVRLAAEDIAENQLILKKGEQLRAQELGLAASIGQGQLNVTRRIKVGIFFTGDELVEPGQPLAAGKIYDSNRYTLSGLLQSLGCEIVDLGIVGDTLEQTKAAILKASENTDLVITSGGVSVGEEDYVRIALEQLGQMHMWRLKIKPGKPLAFGQVNNTSFIGLPGNPVSVFATFCLFVSPFIKKLQGRTRISPERSSATALFDWPRPDSRREFVRARLSRNDEFEPQAELYPNQGSGVLMSTSWADGFVDITEGQTIQQGDRVKYLSFAEMLT